jgi:hypothetical protein
MKTFEKWRIDEVLDTFGLRRVPEQQFAPLASWLKARHPATGAEQAQIEEMRAELALNAEYWNEVESYVMGRFWFFVALLGQEYAVSNAYNASDDDVWAILGILREAKRLIKARLAPGQAN